MHLDTGNLVQSLMSSVQRLSGLPRFLVPAISDGREGWRCREGHSATNCSDVPEKLTLYVLARPSLR